VRQCALQRVAVFCSVLNLLQRARVLSEAVCIVYGSLLQCVQYVAVWTYFERGSVCCSVLQCVAVYCIVLQCVAVRCSADLFRARQCAWQCVAVCCNLL